MADFEFLQNKLNGKWVISAPMRSHRTNASGKTTPICPFCPGNEMAEEELYRVSSNDNSDWQVRVISNKFPFAPHHEIIIHSPDHHKSFDELPFSQVELILKTYRERYNYHTGRGSARHRYAQALAGGQVYILHNSGSQAGASLSHPHTQLVVIPQNVKLDITPLDSRIYSSRRETFQKTQSPVDSDSQIVRQSDKSDMLSIPSVLETEQFYIFCPATSEWPDEIWLAPRQNGGGFGLIKDEEITDMSFVLSRLIQIFDLRHGSEFPFNFYIPPLKNWYLRLIPRIKVLGGFELGTNVIVNTQDPTETFNFIQEHFWHPDHKKIKSEHQAKYSSKV